MPTRAQVRRFTLPLLGEYFQGVATSGSSTSALECTAWPFKSSISQEDRHQDQFLFRPAAVSAADAERVVKTYTPSSGTLTPDLPWSASPYSGSGETFEISGRLPITEPQNGFHALLNEALKRLKVVEEFTLTPVAQQTRHSLAAQTWLTNPDWVMQVGLLATGEDRNKVNPYQRVIRGEAIKLAGVVYLDHPGLTFNATDTLYVKVLAPAYDRCAAAATPTVFTQSGLLLESDVCLPGIERAGWATVVEANLRLGNLIASDSNAQVRQNLVLAAQMVTKFNRSELKDAVRTFRPGPAHWGPTRR